MKPIDPPAILQRFFRWFCHDAHIEGLEGDLYEIFDRRVERQGAFIARCLYIIDMVTLLRSSVVRPLKRNSKLNNMGILKNYMKTAVRLAWKRKSFSAINLIGLTIGITCVTFISLYVHDELGYDRHIADANLKYRFYNVVEREGGNQGNYPIVPPMYATSIRENFPQFEKAGRVLADYGGTIFNVGDRAFSEKNGIYAEREAIEILDLEIVAGSIEDLLAPKKVLLSQSTFRKFFGDEPFDGQTLQLTRSTLDIAGIYKDVPTQSHLRPDYIFSFEWLEEGVPESRMNSWRWQQFFTYFQLKEGTDHELLQGEFQKYVAGIAHPITSEVGLTYLPYFQKLSDIHLHSSDFQWELAEVGNYESILFLSLAAGIILLIACLNFINLTTAQSIKRAKEVGIRKFVGASRTQVLTQSIMESFLYCLLAGVVSVGLIILGLESFNQFAGKSFLMTDVFSWANIAIMVLGIVTLSLVSGWYPALVVMKFQPLAVLHGSGAIRLDMGGRRFRFDGQLLLVGGQYVLSIGLILVALIFSDQYHYLLNRDMGFNKDNLLTIPLTRNMRKDLDGCRAAFSRHSGIDATSFCYGVPGDIVAGDGAFFPELIDHELSSNMFLVDDQYLEVMDIDVIAGRGFSSDLASDASGAFLINETAVKNLGLDSPEKALGTTVRWKMWVAEDTFKVGRVVGVVRDFNYKSLHHEVENVILHIEPSFVTSIVIRLNGNQLPQTLDFVESAYREFEPTRPFEYQFVDQSFARFYEAELKLERLFSLFAMLAILTAVIGLYGLVSYSVLSRSKEISIRKVLGAGAGMIFQLIAQRYLLLVLVAMVIALPLSYYLASSWLENFAYAIDISMNVFVKVVAITLALTLFTVGYQALRGAFANPADRLRNE